MILAERLAKRHGRGFHSAFVTSFAVEFAGFEEVMLPHLAASGANNVLLIADERMTALALSDGSILPQQLGRAYALCGPLQAAGVFHPKIVLQLGRDGGRAMVGSANATAAGIGGNVELVAEIACGTERSPEQGLIRAIWDRLAALSATADGAERDALSWALDRTPWLQAATAEAEVTLDDGSLLAFLASPAPAGIGDRFTERVAGPVERLIVLSPYWDNDLAALRHLKAKLGDPPTTILLDVHSHDFPARAAGTAFEIADISDWEKGRFKHAKLILAQTADHDHLLSGSANCTIAALAGAGAGGVNAEGCLYRRAPAGAAMDGLGLAPLLAGPAVDPRALEPRRPPEPIPLERARRLRPGRFEIQHGNLYWTPPADRAWAGDIVLLDYEGREVDLIEIGAMHATVRQPYVSVKDVDAVHFARITDGTTLSMVAPVIHRALLRDARREPAGRSVMAAQAQFEGREDLQLFLLQALDELQRADAEDHRPRTPAPVRGERGKRPAEEPEAEILSYEQFVQQRPSDRRGGQPGDNSLAGSHGSGVRDLLNRLAGIEAEPSVSRSEPDDDDDWLSGDEPGPDADEDEAGKKDAATIAPEPEPSAAAPLPLDRGAFERAVKAYEAAMRNDGNGRPITGADVLRLRFWLMLLLHAACWRAYPGGLPASTEESGWPRMAVRIITAFFYPPRAPIARLVLDGGYLELPVDFLECWATVLWVLDSLPQALRKASGRAEFLRRLPLLRERVVQRLGLTAADFTGETMLTVTAALERRFGERFPA